MDLPMSYRITGPQSVARLEPLLLYPLGGEQMWLPAELKDDAGPIHFVWETTCEITVSFMIAGIHMHIIFEDFCAAVAREA